MAGITFGAGDYTLIYPELKGSEDNSSPTVLYIPGRLLLMSYLFGVKTIAVPRHSSNVTLLSTDVRTGHIPYPDTAANVIRLKTDSRNMSYGCIRTSGHAVPRHRRNVTALLVDCVPAKDSRFVMLSCCI